MSIILKLQYLFILLEKIKNRIRTYQAYFRLKKDIRKKEFHNTPKTKIVLFNFQSIGATPYQYALASFFADAGYTILLQNNVIWLGNLGYIAKLFLKFPQINIVNSIKDTQNVIYISDHSSDLDLNTWKKSFIFNYNSFRSNPDNYQKMLLMPYPMHPRNCGQEKHQEILDYRKNQTKMRIFFSGNQNPAIYDNPILSSLFHQLSRIKILNILRENLSNQEIFVILHPEDKLVLEKNYQNKLVLNEWISSEQHSNNLESRIKNDDWLKQLSFSDFFLACPGMNQPWCHNIIEAMSVGCIPILEYGHLFSPVLEHQKNAIIFEGETDLLEKIKYVLSLSPDQIHAMKNKVIEYYEQFLAPLPFIEKLEKISPSRNDLYIFAETVSHQSMK
ncbi:hypothetical protein AD998_13375 [bacterium 336/3]|nr:hypothetical protein AD998_13375 [bacterium 336/3]